MMDIKLFCFNCMDKLDDPNQICPTCGHDNHIRTNAHDQLPNSVVGKRYLIGHALGRGGFGITYIGRDLMLNRKIAVKEFFPHNLVTRMTGASTIAAVDDERGELFARGKVDALQEAQIIAKLGQIPHTVSVYDIFEANNSFYIVMEYIDGLTLRKYVEISGGKLAPKEALDMLRPLFATLSRVHKQGVIHRDISPDNIMVRNETDEVVLLDFGAARIVDEQEETLSINPVFRSGYAPLEQYIRRVRLTPRTDEYALCATLFFCVTGQKPQDAQERAYDEDHLVLPEDVASQFKPHQLDALTKGLSLKAADRYETIDELEEALYQKLNQPEEEQKKAEKDETGEVVPVNQPKPLLKRKAVIILITVCIMVSGVLIGIGLSRKTPQELYMLGYNYENGLNGVEQNYEKAVEYYQSAADQNYGAALWRLGVCYELGIGVEKSFGQAVYYYEKASTSGAQYRLGICYQYGNGVEKNFDKANEYFVLAGENGKILASLGIDAEYEKLANFVGKKIDIPAATSLWSDQKHTKVWPREVYPEAYLFPDFLTITLCNNDEAHSMKYLKFPLPDGALPASFGNWTAECFQYERDFGFSYELDFQDPTFDSYMGTWSDLVLYKKDGVSMGVDEKTIYIDIDFTQQIGAMLRIEIAGVVNKKDREELIQIGMEEIGRIRQAAQVIELDRHWSDGFYSSVVINHPSENAQVKININEIVVTSLESNAVYGRLLSPNRKLGISYSIATEMEKKGAVKKMKDGTIYYSYRDTAITGFYKDAAYCPLSDDMFIKIEFANLSSEEIDSLEIREAIEKAYSLVTMVK